MVILFKTLPDATLALITSTTEINVLHLHSVCKLEKTDLLFCNLYLQLTNKIKIGISK